jgi:2-iminoacetate synthase ThiH
MNLNELNNQKVAVTIAGEEVEVNAADSVKDTLKKILQDKGIDSFTITGHEIEVERYVKAG